VSPSVDIYSEMRNGWSTHSWFSRDSIRYTNTTPRPRTYDDFVKSAYYNAFVKFGRYIMHINPLYPDKYIDYVLRSKIKLDHWARDDLYEEYLIETLKSEPVESALQRSIATMMDWANEQNAQWSQTTSDWSTPIGRYNTYNRVR
jgi:hypothetical protein